MMQWGTVAFAYVALVACVLLALAIGVWVL